MLKNLIIVAVIGVAAYWVGVESAKSRGKNYEDLRHQIERLWTSPEATKARKKRAKNAQRLVKKAQKRVLSA